MMVWLVYTSVMESDGGCRMLVEGQSERITITEEVLRCLVSAVTNAVRAGYSDNSVLEKAREVLAVAKKEAQ
jgi:hypothetical protein